MTDTQLYLAIGVRIVANAAMLTLVITMLRGYLDARIKVVETILNERLIGVNQRFDGVNQRFDSVNQRFDDMKNLWTSELRRVERSWTPLEARRRETRRLI